MPHHQRRAIIVEGTPIEIVESGPRRSTDTVVVFGVEPATADELLIRLGRFTRVLVIQRWIPSVIDALEEANIHVVIASGAESTDDIVDLFKRLVTID